MGKRHITKNETAYFFANGAEHELINHLDLNILVGGLATRKADLDVIHPFQLDPYFRFYYIEEGTVDLFFISSKQTLRPGYMYLIPALQPFRYSISEGFTHYWIHFCSSQLERLNFFQYPLECLALENTGNLMRRFLVFAKTGYGINALSNADIILRQLLIPFLELLPEHDYQQIKAVKRYQNVIEYINRNFSSKLCIPKLAKLAGINRNEFSADFHRTFGIPPKQYICKKRIGQAKIMLLNTDFNIKQIAYAIGYDNEFFFSRLSFNRFTLIFAFFLRFFRTAYLLFCYLSAFLAFQ